MHDYPFFLILQYLFSRKKKKKKTLIIRAQIETNLHIFKKC